MRFSGFLLIVRLHLNIVHKTKNTCQCVLFPLLRALKNKGIESPLRGHHINTCSQQ